MRRLAVALVLVALVCPAQASALTPQCTGALAGSNAFVGIVKRGERFRAYVSDATAEGATLSVWFRGDVSPDGRAFLFSADSGFGGGLVERNYRHAGVSHRSGWIVLRDKRVRGRTTVAGTALDGTAVTGPGIRPNPSCVWELRLNRGRGSPAAYRA